MTSLVEQVLLDNPVPTGSHRAPKGFWAEPIQAVRALVTAGFNVSEACRRVLDTMGLPISRLAQIRAAYYNRFFREHLTRK